MWDGKYFLQPDLEKWSASEPVLFGTYLKPSLYYYIFLFECSFYYYVVFLFIFINLKIFFDAVKKKKKGLRNRGLNTTYLQPHVK